MNRRRVVSAVQLASVGALLALGIAAKAEASGPCITIFRAGIGVVDSCTGEPASPYRDLPPLPVATPAPAPPTVITQIVYVTVDAPAPPKKKANVNPTIYTPPVQSCGYVFNMLGRCPVGGDKWVYDTDTGKVYPGTSVVPPYSDVVP